MIARCPACLAKFTIEDSEIGPKGIKLPCSKCGTMFPVIPPGEEPAPPAQAPEAAPPASAETVKAMVLVAHDSHAFCKEAQRVLYETPHDIKIVIAHDDEELLSVLESEPPDIILVDMALPGMFGFEVTAKIKKNKALSHIKVILASSVYLPIGYKRTPSSLCGADDYIEAHRIQDMLVAKVVRLLSGEAKAAVAPKPVPKPVPVPTASAAAEAPKPETKPASPNPDSTNHQSAQRLARLIVNDIALYNKETIEKGTKGGNVMKLLEKDLKEARDFYVKRVAEDIRLTTNYLEDELQILFKAKAAAPPNPAPKTTAETQTSAEGPKPAAKPGAPPPDAHDHQKAQRLARTIVSDINLYSQGAIEKGLKSGNVMKFLKRDLKEARDLYVKRVAEDIRLTTNYLGDELQALFDRKRKELGL